MPTKDRVVSIHPYFRVSEGKMDAFKKLCERFVATTSPEPACLYYGFSFDGDMAHCREAYEGAEGLLKHLANVDELLKEALTIAEIARLEIHGTVEELAKLRGPLAHLSPAYFTLEFGIRRGAN